MSPWRSWRLGDPHERVIMNETDMTLDQILTIGGLGSGPYGGGDVVHWSPDGQELLIGVAGPDRLHGPIIARFPALRRTGGRA